MPKKSSNKKERKQKSSEMVDAQTWINHRSYGQLKEWLREATQQRLFLPVVIPHNVMPAAYLTQLLEKSEPQTKTYLRTIIPELIKEWGRNDDPQCLDDLLILCGYLNCNEAENAISRIVTEKLAHTPEHTELRQRALSVLQEIGTDRSLHIFKRYVGEFDYAAVCYRSLYLLNLNYAVTELQDLITLYESYNATEELEDVLKILFKYTLTSPQYICVLQPLVDLTPSDTFLKVLELLNRLDIVNEAFFIQLSVISRVELIKRILKRGDEKDWPRICATLEPMGLTIDPPPLCSVTPEPEDAEDAVETEELVAVNRDAPFILNLRGVKSVPVVTVSELGEDKTWAYIRSYEPDVMSMFDGPVM